MKMPTLTYANSGNITPTLISGLKKEYFKFLDRHINDSLDSYDQIYRTLCSELSYYGIYGSKNDENKLFMVKSPDPNQVYPNAQDGVLLLTDNIIKYLLGNYTPEFAQTYYSYKVLPSYTNLGIKPLYEQKFDKEFIGSLTFYYEQAKLSFLGMTSLGG